MNPHDPRERPGAHQVAEMFGVDGPWELSDSHPVGSPLDLIRRTVAKSARDVDELHSALAQTAQSAIDALTPIARGDIAGMGEQGSPLHTTGPDIGLLLARRASASVQLTRALSSYWRLQLRSDAKPHSVVRNQGDRPSAEQPQVRNDDWAISGDRQRRALEAVEAGGLRFHRSSIWPDDIWLSDGSGQRPRPRSGRRPSGGWLPMGSWIRTPARGCTAPASSCRSRRKVRPRSGKPAPQHRACLPPCTAAGSAPFPAA